MYRASLSIAMMLAMGGTPALAGQLPGTLNYANVTSGRINQTVAEMASGSTKTPGAIELDLKDSYGQFNILHMNQDAVIR